MKVHVLQHVPFEGLGSMEPWFAEHDATLGCTRFFESTALPSLHHVDLIVAMGGPMSVNDELTLPWLVEEKQFLRDAIDRGVPVLGVCLGSQLIASALGARVYPNARREIGWFDIEATPSTGETFQFPDRTSVFHWHGETFDLPTGAIQLARSAACENQAFQFGRTVMGLQFHLEVTPASADAMLTHIGEELTEEPFVQSEAAMRNVPATQYAHANQMMASVLQYLTGASD